MAEAKFAIGSTEEARSDTNHLVAASSEAWMAKVVRDRFAKLEDLLGRIKERTVDKR